MECRRFEKIVMTARVSDRSSAETEFLAAHELRCAGCRKLREDAEALERVMGAIATPATPDDFTSRVMTRVAEVRDPAPASWHERLFGALRAPAPVFSLQQALAAAALVLMLVSAGMLLGRGRTAVPGTAPATVTIADRPGGAVIQLDKDYVNELVSRHQGAATMQPLADGDSMRLVSY